MESFIPIFIALFIIALSYLSHKKSINENESQIRDTINNSYQDKLRVIDSDAKTLKHEIKRRLSFNQGKWIKISNLIYEVVSKKHVVYLFKGDWLTSETPGLGIILINQDSKNDRFQITKHYEKSERIQNIDVGLQDDLKSKYLIRSLEKVHKINLLYINAETITKKDTTYFESFIDGHMIFKISKPEENDSCIGKLLELNDELISNSFFE